jgi:voltage-gated potassium channel Kch
MLYFSAVTATTLGFGDIVPVTTYARILVTIEAVAEVSLIGLFLNSIAGAKGRNG